MDSAKRLSCSLIIRCYNEGKHIGRLLDGIKQQTLDGLEIIVVDSGSTDDTIQIAKKYPIKLLHIQPEDFSFGRALNLGCGVATGEVIVIASAHVYPVYQDWLEQLLGPFSNPKIGLVYGKQRGNHLTKFSEHQVLAQWFPEASIARQEHPFCNNANAAIRRCLWEEIPYNEELTGLEDLQWAKTAMERGYFISYSAGAEVIHAHDETPSRIFNRYRREALAMRQVYPDQRFNLWDFFRLFFANMFNDYYHAGCEKVFWENIGKIWVFRLMQFWGTYRGFSMNGPVTDKLRQTFYYPRGLVRVQNQAGKEAVRIHYDENLGERSGGQHY